MELTKLEVEFLVETLRTAQVEIASWTYPEPEVMDMISEALDILKARDGEDDEARNSNT